LEGTAGKATGLKEVAEQSQMRLANREPKTTAQGKVAGVALLISPQPRRLSTIIEHMGSIVYGA
jgi:hypothetical protein